MQTHWMLPSYLQIYQTLVFEFFHPHLMLDIVVKPAIMPYLPPILPSVVSDDMLLVCTSPGLTLSG